MENLLVSIASFKKLHIGDFVKEKFELKGIECFLTDEGFEITDDNFPKGFKLKVGLKDTEKAIKILLQVHKEYDLDKIKQDSSLIKDKKKILIPVDISGYQTNALEYAFGIARKTDAEVKLLYVYKDPTQEIPVKYTTSWQEHERIEAAETYNKAQTDLLNFRNKLKQQIDKKLSENTKTTILKN